MNPVLQSAAGNPENQDRGLILSEGARTLLCVADGAGGLSGGTEAAIMATEFFRQNSAQLSNDVNFVKLLQQMDVNVSRDATAGETTFAFAIATANEIFGASVGDSGVWFISTEGNVTNLTVRQQRKPLIGSGAANPVAFQFPRFAGTLLLATDGLLKYTSAERIVATCHENSPDIAAQRLIELVRYTSGRLPDDVTVILTKL